MTLLVLLAFALGAFAIVSVIRGVAAPKTHADLRVREIDLYGYAAGTAEPVSERTPITGRALAQRVGDLIGKRFGTERDARIRKEILAAGMYNLTPRALIGYQVIAASFAGLYGLLLDFIPNVNGPIFDTIFLAAIGWVIPITWVRRTGRLRLETIERGLPDVIDLIVVSVEAGQGFAQAMSTAAERTPGALGDELRLTLREQRFGLAVDRALENLNERADTPNMRTFVRGVVQGERLGVSIGQIMRNIAREMRLRRRQSAEERAQKTTVKILIPLVFLILPPMIIILMTPAVLSLGDVL